MNIGCKDSYYGGIFLREDSVFYHRRDLTACGRVAGVRRGMGLAGWFL